MIYICAAVSVALVASCSHEEHAEAPEEPGEASGIIEFPDESAVRFGVQTDTVRPGVFHAVVRAAGRVERGGTQDAVVSAPAAGIVRYARGIECGAGVGKGALIATVDSRGVSGGDVNAAAAVRLETARLELDRIEDLYDERLATQSELIAAQNEYAAARAAYSPSASTGRATAPVAGTVNALVAKEGQYVGVGDVIATIGSGAGSLLRVSLPQRYFSQAKDFTDMTADFASLGRLRVSATGGKRVAGDASSSVTGAYLPVYFTVPANFAAGSAFTAYLIGAPREGVLTVPVEALSEQQGHFYVYRRTSPGHYEKLPVTTGVSDGDRVEIVSGVPAGAEIVTSGVTAVRLAETSGAMPEGHSHNH